MKPLLKKICVVILLLIAQIITGCGGDGLNETPDERPTLQPQETQDKVSLESGSLSLSVHQFAIKSDSSDSATVTATVVDQNNSVVQGVDVSFKASSGQLSHSLVTTDANGEASVSFSSGHADKSNRIATITASAEGVESKQIPVSISGTTVKISTDTTKLELDGDNSATLTISLKDAGGYPIYNAMVDVQIEKNSAGNVLLTPSQGTTNVNGVLEVDVTGQSIGDASLKISALGATNSQHYVVGTNHEVFSIIAPSTSTAFKEINTSSTVTVLVPDPSISTMVFSTTLGVWDDTDRTMITTDIVQDESSGKWTASAKLTSNKAGKAQIQVYAAQDTSIMDKTELIFYLPVEAASELELQTSTRVVAPSIGQNLSTAILTATVRNGIENGNQVVSFVPVTFSIENPTGSGESIFPVTVLTNEFGQAETTFTSGALPTGQTENGIIVSAKAYIGTLTISDQVNIMVGGTAGSVMIGRGTEVMEKTETDPVTGETIIDPATYVLPMSLVVADSNGNPVSNALVSLSTWPESYSSGVWYDKDPHPSKDYFVPYISGTFVNEDKNENLHLDEGEDTNANGTATPPNSSAGILPTTVNTDEHGVANFNLVYAKQSAVWITSRIRATTFVLGSETTTTYSLSLPYEKEEGIAGFLPDSPYPIGLTVMEVGQTNPYQLAYGDSYATSLLDSEITETGVYVYTEPGTGTIGDVIEDSIYIELLSAFTTIAVPVEIRIIE